VSYGSFQVETTKLTGCPDGLLPVCPLSGSVYNRFSQAYLRLLIGEIGGNSTKRPFRLPLDIATRLEKWI
jgi:hypothetical protein